MSDPVEDAFERAVADVLRPSASPPPWATPNPSTMLEDLRAARAKLAEVGYEARPMPDVHVRDLEVLHRAGVAPAAEVPPLGDVVRGELARRLLGLRVYVSDDVDPDVVELRNADGVTTRFRVPPLDLERIVRDWQP